MNTITPPNVLDAKKANYLLNLRETREGRLVLSSLPVALYVDVNLKCNLKCPTCFRMDPRLEGVAWPTMDFELFAEIARTLFPTALKVNLSGGGESLLNPDFDRMLDLCLRHEVRPYLYTNGTPITPARAELLVRAGAQLSFSIDGATPQTFERLRYPARWRRMTRSLAIVRDTWARFPNERFRPSLGVVVQKENLAELPGFVDLAAEYGFPLIVFTKLNVDFPELEAKVPAPAAAHEALVETYRRASEKRIVVRCPDYGPTPLAATLRALVDENDTALRKDPAGDGARGPIVHRAPLVYYPDMYSKLCGVPWSETLIQPDGRVSIGCCSGFQMGDVTERPFAEIWNGERYQELRRSVNSHDPWRVCSAGTCGFRSLSSARRG